MLPNFDQSFGFAPVIVSWSELNQLIFGSLPTTVLKSDIEISRLFSASILFEVASAKRAFAWKTSVLVTSLNSNLFSVASNFLIKFSSFFLDTSSKK